MVQPGPSNAGVNVPSSQGVPVGSIGMGMQSQGVGSVPGVVNVNPQGVGAVGVSSVSAPLQRTYIWSGVLEWMEKGKAPGDQKIIRQLPCQVLLKLTIVRKCIKIYKTVICPKSRSFRISVISLIIYYNFIQ